MSLDGRVAVVTGASSGIGQGVALRLAELGARVAVVDLAPGDDTLDLLSRVGGEGRYYATDVSDSASVTRSFEAIAAELGAPHALVNAAGIFADEPFLETPLEVYERVMAVNARGVFLACQQAGRQMAEAGGGRIINILSTAAAQGFAYESAYCASKGAALLLTRVLAVELAEYDITVNGVGPGTVETKMGGEYLARGPIPAHELTRTPLGRFGKPTDIAAAVAFFVETASWVTGQVLYVDGGFLAAGLPVLEGL